MNKVLLSCIAFAACTTIAMAQDRPAFPEKLEYALNGETQLAGVTVVQDYDKVQEEFFFTVSGTCAAEKVTIDFVNPEGWDGFLVSKPISAGPSPWTTRGDYEWTSVEGLILRFGFTKTNTVTFDVNGKLQLHTLSIFKGEKACATPINVSFKVEYKEDDEEASVESIERIDGKAAYYSVNGNRIVNPTKGIYVKVLDGKASKVVVK